MTTLYDVINEIDTKSEDIVFKDPRIVLESLCGIDYEQIPIFIKKVVYASLDNYSLIKNKIETKLIDWKWERLPVLTRAIFLLSYSHYYLIEEKVDKSIVIDVAINLAKRYIDEKQAKFINAVLNGVLQ